jgi:chemotaxis signal transduction protein
MFSILPKSAGGNMKKEGNEWGMEELIDKKNQIIQIPLDFEGKYLTFNLAGVGSSVCTLQVKEDIGILPAGPIFQTPDFIKGVVTLQDMIIPVVDLGFKFGMTEITYTERTCIAVVEIAGQGGSFLIGLIMDVLSEC